mgnify:CR=1 FL=1
MKVLISIMPNSYCFHLVSRFPWFFSFLPAHSGSFLSTFFLSVQMRHHTECQPEQYGEEPTQTDVFEPSSSVYSGLTLKTATQTQ